MAAPTVAEVADALGKPAEAIAAAYAAEVAAQAAQCRVDPLGVDAYDPALVAALVRRVKRAKAMEAVTLGVIQDDTGAIRIGSVDPEVRRLEAPYRRTPLG
jgi:hypothetical protein